MALMWHPLNSMWHPLNTIWYSIAAYFQIIVGKYNAYSTVQNLHKNTGGVNIKQPRAKQKEFKSKITENSKFTTVILQLILGY